MQDHRPLSEVPTRALYALHKGIEGRGGLSGRFFHIDVGDDKVIDTYGDLRDDCRTCALGSLGESHEDAAKTCAEYGLLQPESTMYRDLTVIGKHVERLNDKFNGTPEERREFMLREIVNELRHRKKFLPTSAPKKELVLNG